MVLNMPKAGKAQMIDEHIRLFTFFKLLKNYHLSRKIKFFTVVL